MSNPANKEPPPEVFESPRDDARFVRSAAFGGIEIMHASLVDHAFAPHAHNELMIGILHDGIKEFERERESHRVGRYGLSINNPGDIHTGRSADGEKIQYTALYLTGDVLRTIGCPPHAGLRSATVFDLRTWAHLRHAAATSDQLEAEEHLAIGVHRLVQHAGDRTTVDPIGAPASIETARAFIHTHAHTEIRLDQLAAVAQLSVRHLIRSFRDNLGTTPHRYLTSVRVSNARALLRRGVPIADAALRCGFADQAHLTRTFRPLVGTTPGRYQAAVHR